MPEQPPSNPPGQLAAARKRVIQTLSDHFANDDLSMEELEQRLEQAYRVTSVAELAALTADLRSAPGTAATPATAPDLVPSTLILEHERVVAIMSESKRVGAWPVPQRLDVVALMSDATIDLTHAQLPAGIIDIHVRAMWASVKIILPPGLRGVANRLSTLMASLTNELDDSPPLPGAPTIRLSGTALMAEVKVTVRRREDDHLLPGG